MTRVGPTRCLPAFRWGRAGLHAYFVHSYHLRTADAADLVARVRLWRAGHRVGGPRQLAGTQFHPEKSQKLGLALIANFLNWKP